MINYTRARAYNLAQRYTAADLALIAAALRLPVADLASWSDTTLDAVARWQKAHELKVDGGVGKETLGAMRAAASPLQRPVPLNIAEASREHPDEVWAVDLSNNRPSVDLHRLKRETNTRAVVVKATEGAHFVDPTADTYAAQARAAGLAVGAFFWPWPIWRGEAAKMEPQAQNFARWVARQAAHGALEAGAWIDVEAGTIGNMDAAIEAWGVERAAQWMADCAARTEDLIGAEVGMYTNHATIQKLGIARLQRLGLIGTRPLWYAYFPRPAPRLPAAQPPKWGGDWAMWQMTSKGLAPGYDKGVDFNVLNRNSALYRAIKGTSC